MGSSPPIKNIYFFDDNGFENKPTPEDLKNAKELGYNIKFILVNQTREGRVAQKYRPSADNPLSHHGYVGQKEYIYPGGGIGDKEINDINKALANNNAAALVFDWDQTLSLIEGIYAPQEFGYEDLAKIHNLYLTSWKAIGPNFTKEELAEYFLHDPNDPLRINKLKAALQQTKQEGIPIFILTNNTNPIYRRQFLVDILQTALGITVPLDHIIKGGVKGPLSKGQTIVEKIIPLIQKAKEEATPSPFSIHSGLRFTGRSPEAVFVEPSSNQGGRTKKRKFKKSKKSKKRKLRKTKNVQKKKSRKSKYSQSKK